MDFDGRLGAAARRAGWHILQPGVQLDAMPQIALLISDRASDRLTAGMVEDGLNASLDKRDPDRTYSLDFSVSPRASDAALSSIFADWLPPDHHELDRMAAAFGREGMVPLLEGVRAELRAAVVMIDAGGRCDAHKLAGLTGTLGFAEASRVWRQEDEGGGTGDAIRRVTRAATVSISSWLAR